MLVCCWWECKLVQPLQEIIWKFLTKLNTELRLLLSHFSHVRLCATP